MRKVLVFFVSALLFLSSANAQTVYVCISEDSYLNGRARPSTRAEITMRLYNGDELEVVRFCGEWVEIIGGESGTSFCKAKYVSEVKDPVFCVNASGGRVRIRSSAIDGKGVGWVKAGGTVKVTRQLLGWGYIGTGWVDLSYFEANKQ